MVKNVMRSIFFLTIVCLLAFAPCSVLAEVSGIGGIAGNLLEPVNILTDFVTSVSLIIGATFLFAAFIKYMQHRVNPMAIPISNVLFLLFFGVVLLCLPLAYKIMYDAPPTGIVEKK
jgi:hypothetical protein